MLKMIFLSKIKRLAKADIFIVSSCYFCILLIIATIAQKYIGIEIAKDKFLLSYFIWLYFIPLPGGMLILIIIFLNLVSKTILSPWKKGKIGHLISHIGSILIFISALFTYQFVKEGYITLAHSQQQNYFSDYDKVNLEIEFKGKKILLSEQQLKKKKEISLSPAISVQINDFFINATIDENRIIKNKKSELEAEDNLQAVYLSVIANKEIRKIFLINKVQNIKHVEIDSQNIKFRLLKRRYDLPFTVKLIKFEKITYPGTDIASSYQSFVKITDPDNIYNGKYLIRENNPLRIKDYSIFQSSFLINEENQTQSILLVVKNFTRLMPYLAFICLLFGLIIYVVEIKYYRNAKKQD
jgi:hypothetical protein